MPTRRGPFRYLSHCFLFLAFVSGLVATSYAQPPLFPPQLGNNSSGIAGLQSTASQSSVDPTRQDFQDNELLGFAGIHLVNAIGALQGGDTNSLNNNLNVSQHQFEAVLGPSGSSDRENDNKSIAFGGINLVNAIRSFQGGDFDSLNSSLTVSLEQFAGVLGVSPSLILNAPAAASGPPTDNSQAGVEQSNGEARESPYDDNELLAYAGIHLINAIRALQSNDMSSLEGNLMTAQQQFWSARYPG